MTQDPLEPGGCSPRQCGAPVTRRCRLLRVRGRTRSHVSDPLGKRGLPVFQVPLGMQEKTPLTYEMRLGAELALESRDGRDGPVRGQLGKHRSQTIAAQSLLVDPANDLPVQERVDLHV